MWFLLLRVVASALFEAGVGLAGTLGFGLKFCWFGD